MARRRNSTKKSDSNSKDTKMDHIPRKVLYSWKSPMRHFKKMDMKKYWTVVAFVLVLFVFLAILSHFYWFMAAIAAIMFLVYVVGTVKPSKVEHKVTTQGVETVGGKFKWEDFKDYWFARKDDQMHLYIDTELKLPGRVVMLVDKKDVEKLHKILHERLNYKDLRKQSRVSKVLDGEWMNKLDG